MLPSIALLPSARAMLVPRVDDRLAACRRTGSCRRGSPWLSTAVRNHCAGSAVPAGGRLLEWHDAQFSAKARRPVLSVSADAVRYCAPPGASFSRSGFISLQEAFGVRHPRFGAPPVLAVLPRVIHFEGLLLSSQCPARDRGASPSTRRTCRCSRRRAATRPATPTESAPSLRM